MTRKEFFTVARSTLREFNRDDVSLLAAGVTYFAFLSIFPLLVLAITLAGIFFTPADASEFIFRYAAQYAPGSRQLLAEAMGEAFSNRADAWWLALIGLIALMFSASNAFGILDKAINRAWQSEKVPGFIVSKLVSFAMMLVVGVLLILASVAAVVLSMARRAASRVAGGEVPGSSVFWHIVSIGVSLALVFVIFLLMYRYLPRCDVSWRDVWPGALLAAVAWVLLKELFAIFLSTPLADFSATYGTVSTVVALLIWIYLSSLIILTGAEFTSETYHVRRLRVQQGLAQLEHDRPRRSSPWFSSAGRSTSRRGVSE
jgi:membrane protein